MRWVFRVSIAASLLLIMFALHYWGAAEIRANESEALFLGLFGVLWLVLAVNAFPWLGLSFRDDVSERKNIAALIAICGALLAAAVIYSGSSIGEGPSYLDNFFCLGLGAASLLVLWMLMEIIGGISKSITEDRDLASGIRLGGFLLAAGLVFGRALAGDWHSASATVHDFLQDGWPALFICAVAVMIERFARPSRRRPFPTWADFGLVPALLYLVLAAAWLSHLGPWEGMP